MQKIERIGCTFIFISLLALWATWFYFTNKAITFCEVDLPACEAAYFANLGR